MDGHIFVSLFESVVLANVVQVITANDDSSLHLILDDNTSQNTTTDGNISGE